MTFVGLGKSGGEAIKKRQKRTEVTNRSRRNNHLLHLANTSAPDEPPPTGEFCWTADKKNKTKSKHILEVGQES